MLIRFVCLFLCEWMRKAYSYVCHAPSQLQLHQIFGREVYIKRDDCININGLNGNKGRKFDHLMSNPTEKSVYGSYGGIQSNSMAALSKLALKHNKPLYYFTNSIPAIDAVGNFRKVSDQGVKIIAMDTPDYLQLCNSRKSSQAPDVLSKYLSGVDVQWIPQGGCYPEAKQGVYTLGQELGDFFISSKIHTRWKVIVSCGTGTTALLLSQYFSLHHRHHTSVEVLAVPCASSASALRSLMLSLDAECDNLQVLPTIVPSDPKRAFAKPCQTHWTIWNTLRHQTKGVEFDLLYAPRCWELLIECYGRSSSSSSNNEDNWKFARDSEVLKDAWSECGVVYYHCGGVEGNESQLPRYRKIIGNSEAKD